jgi:hypothetical protein
VISPETVEGILRSIVAAHTAMIAFTPHPRPRGENTQVGTNASKPTRARRLIGQDRGAVRRLCAVSRDGTRADPRQEVHRQRQDRLDTYRMNIEERDLRAAFRTAGDRQLHLRVRGNDRGAPGHDLQDWPLIRDCLTEIDHRGMLGIESFTADNASIATAAPVWRPPAKPQDALAMAGLRFLREWREGRS